MKCLSCGVPGLEFRRKCQHVMFAQLAFERGCNVCGWLVVFRMWVLIQSAQISAHTRPVKCILQFQQRSQQTNVVIVNVCSGQLLQSNQIHLLEVIWSLTQSVSLDNSAALKTVRLMSNQPQRTFGVACCSHGHSDKESSCFTCPGCWVEITPGFAHQGSCVMGFPVHCATLHDDNNDKNEQLILRNFIGCQTVLCCC